MLVLSRKSGESLLIGKDIKITVTDIGRGRVRLGIKAPKEVNVVREEIAPPERCLAGAHGGEVSTDF